MKGLKRNIDKIKPHFEKGGKLSKFHSVFDGFYTFLFTPNETSRSGVHIHDSNDSKRTMITVVIALLPCCLFGMWNIGLQHFMAIGDPDREFFRLFFYGFFAVLPQILTAYIVGLGIEFIVAQMRGSIRGDLRQRSVRRHRLQFPERGPCDTCVPLLQLPLEDERRQCVCPARQPDRSRLIFRRHPSRSACILDQRSCGTYKYTRRSAELFRHIFRTVSRIMGRDIHSMHTHRRCHTSFYRHSQLADHSLRSGRRFLHGSRGA